MDCHDVAEALSSDWTANGASSVLSDNYRAEYVEREKVDDATRDVSYEYRLKEDVRIE